LTFYKTRIENEAENVIFVWEKTNGNVESLKYLGSKLTNVGKCTCEIKCRIAMAKAAFNKKRALFTGTFDLKLRKNK